MKPEKYQSEELIIVKECDDIFGTYQSVEEPEVFIEVEEDLTPKMKRSKKSNKRSTSKINTDIMTVDDKKASFVIQPLVNDQRQSVPLSPIKKLQQMKPPRKRKGSKKKVKHHEDENSP